MCRGAEECIRKNVIPLAQGAKTTLILPSGVVEEINRHIAKAERQPQDKSFEEAGRSARRAARLVTALKNEGLVQFFGNPDDVFPDSMFQVLAVQYAERFAFCIVTQDSGLARDLLALGRRKSVTRAKPIFVFRIESDGTLDNWVKPHPDRRLTAAPVRKVAPFTMCGGLPRTLPPRGVSRSDVQAGAVVYSAERAPIVLRERIAAGGEGVVFKSDAGKACKVFTSSGQRLYMHEKLKLMISKPSPHAALCWPDGLLYSAKSEFLGYSMPLASGTPLQRALFIKPVFTKMFPGWRRRDLVELGITITSAIQELHESNILLGDINPMNILVRSQNQVALVDTDSYQIEDFPCPVGMPPFLSPELIGVDLAKKLRRPEHDQFAVVTLVFMLLLPGKPPYSHAGGGDPAKNVKTGHFPYPFDEKRSNGVPLGPWRFAWSHLPFYMKQAFYACFAEHERRPVQDWLELLRRFSHDLQMGYLSDEIYPRDFKRPANVNTFGGLGGHGRGPQHR
jgi:hypothetical protein